MKLLNLIFSPWKMEQRNKSNDITRGNQLNSEFGTFYRKIDPVFSKDQRHKKDEVEALKLKRELRDITKYNK